MTDMSPDRDTFVELVTSEELAELEDELAEGFERVEHLNAIIAHAEAYERLSDDMVREQIVKEVRLKAEQLKESCQ